MDGETTNYYYEDGMTWNDYLSSKFNNNYFMLNSFKNANIIPTKYSTANECNSIDLNNSIDSITPSSLIDSKENGCYSFEFKPDACRQIKNRTIIVLFLI